MNEIEKKDNTVEENVEGTTETKARAMCPCMNCAQTGGRYHAYVNFPDEEK